MPPCIIIAPVLLLVAAVVSFNQTCVAAAIARSPLPSALILIFALVPAGVIILPVALITKFAPLRKATLPTTFKLLTRTFPL